jgi:molybdenum cofactor cytidylyltransferase
MITLKPGFPSDDPSVLTTVATAKGSPRPTSVLITFANSVCFKCPVSKGPPTYLFLPFHTTYLIVAIVLAAGLSTRMGRPKQTLPVSGKSMLERVLETFRQTKVDKVVVVIGANEREVRDKVRFEKERVIVNSEFAKGMSGSLRLGLAAAGNDADAVIVALADQPLLKATTVDRLIEEHLNSKASIIMPVYNGRRGNPVLFDRSLFPQILKVRGDVGAKSVVEKNKAVVLEVNVPDEGVLVDVDTLEDYREILKDYVGL